MPRQFTLGKKERLKSRKRIEQLFSEGKKFTLGPLRIFYIITTPALQDTGEVLQFGVGVSAKSFKKATDRNRIKRLIRESYRLQKIPLQQLLGNQKQQLALFIIYHPAVLPLYKEVYAKTGEALNKLEKILLR